MPSPSKIRESRIKRLASLARRHLENGAHVNTLAGKLQILAQRSWPTVRVTTRSGYVKEALRMVLSHHHTKSVLPEEVGEIPPQEME